MSLTTDEIIAAASELPKLPVIEADTMLEAQACQLTTDEQAAVTAFADFLESIGSPRTVNVQVVNDRGYRIGTLQFAA